jgi:signal transduction histidine kinase
MAATLFALVVPGIVAMLVCFVVGATRPAWQSVAAPTAISLALELIGGGPFNPLALMITFGPWVAGLILGSHRRLARRLVVVGQRLDEERSNNAKEQIRLERVRLARELHDTVAHWLTAVIVQAAAGQVLAETAPALMVDTLDRIAEAARRAGRDVDQAVSLMGGSRTSGLDLLGLLESLVAGAQNAGVEASLARSVSRPLPFEVELTAFRLVQEGLTNAMKHAPGGPIQVTVGAGSDTLDVEVVNEPPTGVLSLGGLSNTGLGLLGLRERVASIGGRIEAGPVADRGWRLAASLPC